MVPVPWRAGSVVASSSDRQRRLRRQRRGRMAKRRVSRFVHGGTGRSPNSRPTPCSARDAVDRPERWIWLSHSPLAGTGPAAPAAAEFPDHDLVNGDTRGCRGRLAEHRRHLAKDRARGVDPGERYAIALDQGRSVDEHVERAASRPCSMRTSPASTVVVGRSAQYDSNPFMDASVGQFRDVQKCASFLIGTGSASFAVSARGDSPPGSR